MPSDCTVTVSTVICHMASSHSVSGWSYLVRAWMNCWMLPSFFLIEFSTLYSSIFGKLFLEHFIYAKKNEKLTTIQQFNPVYYYDSRFHFNPVEIEKENESFQRIQHRRQATLGKDIVITNDRIPKAGLFTIDKGQFEKWNETYSSEKIISELFRSIFITTGYPKE